MSDETCILLKPDAFGEQKRFFVTNLFVMDMPFVCGTQPHNPKISGTQQVVLYAMNFFTTVACRLPVFVHRTLNCPLGSIQQYILVSFEDVYQPFGVTVGQFAKCPQCAAENLRKKVNPPVGLGVGSFQTRWHGAPEGDWSSDIPI